ncbi:triose-phosphate isomerase [Colwellia sp. Bg11-28]|jgi:triosephosphate isomerase|uniref:triose-phosphate isomerase n=1 Tax=Colwellia sp. Bg11-28 TaxID=2058305 RepID=UPI000C33667E|nr:triose-phosphate isomerase [Colwellia sp. Bg11-28]PKH85470.1 triose-phosphate isomerase [Colwellia sp. Bg11-28]|tara:strand:+ start:143 stop:895 length:753 start_codon:yes stop_codon:yes gene_type:complete
MRQALIIGNWKMNGNLAENDELLNTISKSYDSNDEIEVVVCPPSIYMAQISQQLLNSKIKYGAQNVSANRNGAFTGEVSTAMLHDLGCSYVLLGHSERRCLNHESDEQIADKFSAAVQAEITPVLCVGETLTQRQSKETFLVIAEQISIIIEEVGIKGFEHAVIAYEPIWAIGTGETASPEQAQAVHAQIRRQLAEHDLNISKNIQVIYGGSVNADNAKALFAQQDVDGALVGGSSLNADDFLNICKAYN